MTTPESEEALNENMTSLDGLRVYINVWNLAANLAVARNRRDEKGEYYEQVKAFDDLGSIGLTYQDLIDAVEQQGALNRSGWYRITPKIHKAVSEHAEVVKAIWSNESRSTK
jgi:hypothetical protein